MVYLLTHFKPRWKNDFEVLLKSFGLFINSVCITKLVLICTLFTDVLAAGDVAFANWPKEKHWFQMRLWTQARQMGTLAGHEMAEPGSAKMFNFSFESFAHMTKFFGYKVSLNH
jgi:hypothetical protein